MTYPCLWFADDAESAAQHYLATFPGSRLRTITHYPAGSPGPEGSVMTVDLEIGDGRVLLLNGGREIPYTGAVSLVFECPDQATIDTVWDALLTGGGQEIQCGWIEDRFGLQWQIVPTGLNELATTDPAGYARAVLALMPMVKIDMAALWAAARG